MLSVPLVGGLLGASVFTWRSSTSSAARRKSLHAESNSSTYAHLMGLRQHSHDVDLGGVAAMSQRS